LGLALAALATGGCDRRAPAPRSDRATATPVATRPSERDSSADARDAQDAQDATSLRTCATWESIGRGVTVRRCDRGDGVVVLAAGWRITTASTQAWAEALDRARLAGLGARTHFAVEGPEHVDFRGKELAIDALLERLTYEANAGRARWVLVVAHSSGAHVARTLFHRGFAGQRASALRDRVVYVDLDGDAAIREDPERTFGAATVAGLRRAIFAAAEDRARGLRGFSMSAMIEGARRFGAKGELFVFDASAARCVREGCAHLSLINTRPHPNGIRGNQSYSSFLSGEVNVAWLDRAARWLDRGSLPATEIADGVDRSPTVLADPSARHPQTTDCDRCLTGHTDFATNRRSSQGAMTSTGGEHE